MRISFPSTLLALAAMRYASADSEHDRSEYNSLVQKLREAGIPSTNQDFNSIVSGLGLGLRGAEETCYFTPTPEDAISLEAALEFLAVLSSQAENGGDLDFKGADKYIAETKIACEAEGGKLFFLTVDLDGSKACFEGEQNESGNMVVFDDKFFGDDADTISMKNQPICLSNCEDAAAAKAAISGESSEIDCTQYVTVTSSSNMVMTRNTLIVAIGAVVATMLM
jgi:hypothetical protein